MNAIYSFQKFSFCVPLKNKKQQQQHEGHTTFGWAIPVKCDIRIIYEQLTVIQINATQNVSAMILKNKAPSLQKDKKKKKKKRFGS